MDSAETHSAAPAAAGYLYQCQAALLELLRRGVDEPDIVVYLETLDDVEIQRGDVREALQIKHHAGGAGSLTDSSVDLWRTLGVWLDALPTLVPGDRPIFTLVTTGEAPQGSAASMLRQHNDPARDEAAALGRLEGAAVTSTNRETAKARKRFLQLNANERLRLIEAIEVRDAQPPIGDFYGELDRLLPRIVRSEHRDDFFQALEGWWLGKCRQLLNRQRDGVAAQELTNEIHRLRDGYTADNLPPPLDPADLSAAELASYANDPFVKQLEWIAYTNPQIEAAIHDFYNAAAERARWSRSGIVAVGDLDSYERRLVHSWRLAFLDMVRELEDNTDGESARQQAGRALLRQLRAQDSVRVRERFSNEMITHGTLHALANTAQPERQQIGWHPEFEERLEALLKLATTVAT